MHNMIENSVCILKDLESYINIRTWKTKEQGILLPNMLESS